MILMSKEIRADLSLYGLREYFEDKMDEMVVKEPVEGSEELRLKVLSDNNFSDKKVEELKFTYDMLTDIDKSLIPTTVIPELILTSTGVKGKYNWVEGNTIYKDAVEGIKQELEKKLKAEIEAHDEEIAEIVFDYCTRAETQEIVLDEINKYLGNPELVETLVKLNLALKEQHMDKTVGEYILSEFSNKYDKIDGLNLEGAVAQLKEQIKNIKPYELPFASEDTLGGVKVGYGLRMDGYGKLAIDTNVVNVENSHECKYELPIASKEELGGIKVSPVGGLIVDEEGYLKINDYEANAPEEWESKLKTKLNSSCLFVGQAEFSDKTGATIIETDGREVRHVSITPMSLYYSKETGEPIPFSFYYELEEGKVLVKSTIDYNVKDDAPVLFSYMVLLKDQEQ